MGLAISKQLVELMGGSIFAESTPGAGSTFGFSLPLTVDLRETPASDVAINLRGFRALIVSANEHSRRVMHRQVCGWGMRGASCATGVEALTEIRAAAGANDPYRVVVADMQLPELDGSLLAASIKGDPSTRDTIVILTVAPGSLQEPDRAAGTQADVRLTRPVHASRLLLELCNIRSERGLAALPAEVAGQVELPEDFSWARVLVVDNDPGSRSAAVRSLESLGFQAAGTAPGRSVAEILHKDRYDLVLLDCRTPNFGGVETAVEIRKQEAPGCHIPIVAMKIESGASSLNSCLTSGIDDVLLKPIRVEELTRALSASTQVKSG